MTVVQKACYPYDSVDRITTEISNLASMGFTKRQIRQRLFSGWASQWAKHPLQDEEHTASFMWRRMYAAQAAYNGHLKLEGNENAEGDWADHIAWIYTDQWDNGQYYEQAIYPYIKQRVDIFDHMAVLEQYPEEEPETWAY